MQLNETAARIDAQLETVVKKIERVESDTRQVDGAAAQAGGNLVFKQRADDQGSKYREIFARHLIYIKQLAIILTVYLQFIVPYASYIKNFQWDSMKHPLKRTLNEIVISIQKKMHQKDDEIRKQSDEYQLLKQRISALSKKDSGNYTTRDFTDDIYTDNDKGQGIAADVFVEKYQSEMFTNLLMVANDERQP